MATFNDFYSAVQNELTSLENDFYLDHLNELKMMLQQSAKVKDRISRIRKIMDFNVPHMEPIEVIDYQLIDQISAKLQDFDQLDLLQSQLLDSVNVGQVLAQLDKFSVPSFYKDYSRYQIIHKQCLTRCMNLFKLQFTEFVQNLDSKLLLPKLRAYAQQNPLSELEKRAIVDNARTEYFPLLNDCLSCLSSVLAKYYSPLITAHLKSIELKDIVQYVSHAHLDHRRMCIHFSNLLGLPKHF
jgi:hypothetical protein